MGAFTETQSMHPMTVPTDEYLAASYGDVSAFCTTRLRFAGTLFDV